MKNKPLNPYLELRRKVASFVARVRFPHTVTMFRWQKAEVTSNKPWSLDEVYQRALAAKSLGYDVVIECDHDGMSINYRKQVPAELE